LAAITWSQAHEADRGALFVLSGLLLATFTLSQMVGFTDQTSSRTIVVASVVQGFASLVFVPLSTVAFATLQATCVREGTAILTLVAISAARSASHGDRAAHQHDGTMHAHLTEYVTPFNNAMQMPDVRRSSTWRPTPAVHDGSAHHAQAAIIALPTTSSC